MKKLCVILLWSAGILSACNGDGKEDAAKDRNAEGNTMTTEKPMLDHSLVGTYVGKLPCATCDAMLTSIILREDNSYAISTKAINDTSLIFPLVDSGHFVIRDQVLELTDMGGEKTLYRISTDQLAQLGADGMELGANGKQEYIFKKQR